MSFDIKFVKAGELIGKQKDDLSALDQECFGDVPQKEVEENFIAEPSAYLFAYQGDALIARLALYKREIIFSGEKITLGGIGGVCVATIHRHHGIASSMLKRALLTLKAEQCDIACLNVDLEKKIYGIYEKLGFVMMARDISFENARGEIIHEPGTMFVPLVSPEKYNLIMNSTETFHYGRGYW